MMLGAAASAQTVDLIGPGDVQGITVNSGDTFTGQGLYGYINGGADLYLEYGFVKLYVNEYNLGGETLKAEVWVMEDEPSAYGIYALSHTNCQAWNRVSTFSCESRYQLAAANGPLFISVTNNTGSQAAQGYMEMIVRKLLEKNPQDMWYMPALFQQQSLGNYKNTIRYFEGPLGVANGIPVLSYLMEDMNFRMYTIMTSDPGTASMIARIEFEDFSSLNTFLSRAQLNPMDVSSDPVPASNNMYRSWYKVNDTKLIYMESHTPDANLKNYIPKTPPPYWLEN